MKTDETEDTEAVRVAVLDDDPRVGSTIATFLKPLHCAVEVYTDPNKFLQTLNHAAPEILITDLRMPDVDGITVLKIVREMSPGTEVIIVSGNAEKQHAVAALKLGAFDFFEKPVDREDMVETVRRTVRYSRAVRERDRYAGQLSFVSKQQAKRWGIDALIGKSGPVQNIVRDIGLLQKAANTSVLITGESGTGKELVARAIHFGSGRSERPFVPVNCSAIPSELAESTLFGHARGSFTGAVADRAGCFETAHEGTIFLDEIGDMPFPVQIKLLRVLEDGIIVPVGKTTGRTVNVRVIAATNADLPKKIENGQFRADLFYRLAAFSFVLPPLRERKADIPLLVEHFVSGFVEEMGIPSPAIEPETLDLLRGYDFPGNIRELKNMVERALIVSAGSSVKPSHIQILRPTQPPAPRTPDAAPEPAAPAPAPAPQVAAPDTAQLPFNLHEAETVVVKKAIAASNGNMAEAARLLGISRPKLYRKLAAIEGREE